MPLVGLRELRNKVARGGSHRTHAGHGNRARNWLTLCFAIAVALVLAACAGEYASRPPEPGYGPNAPGPGFFPIDSVTEQGVPTQSLYLLTFVIAVIVFALVEGLLIYITLRFRRKPTDPELPPQTHGSNTLELLWTIVPTVVVTVLFVAALITLNEEYEAHAAQPDLVVDVTGFQWQWTFEYPEQGIKLSGTGREGPTMALPVGETVRFRLHATDVIHSFYVPQFLYKKDVIPGRTNEFDVVIKQAGTFAGQCAEFCGLGHADMHFSVQAMTPAEFDAWVTQQQQQPSPGPSGEPTGPTVEVTSVSIADGFDPTALTVAADTAWVVNLTNADPDIPHNFSIHNGMPDGSDWVGQPNADGGGSATYQAPPLPAGDYQFFCSLHPNMVGDLHVGQ